MNECFTDLIFGNFSVERKRQEGGSLEEKGSESKTG